MAYNMWINIKLLKQLGFRFYLKKIYFIELYVKNFKKTKKQINRTHQQLRKESLLKNKNKFCYYKIIGKKCKKLNF